MNCEKHPEREATGTCVYCGNFFCADCLVDVNGRNYCREHVSNAFNEQKQEMQEKTITINNNNNNNSVSNSNSYSDAYAAANAYAGSGYYNQFVSSKSRLIALLLCIFLGVFGVHRFYVGKIGTGILYFFTFGGFGLGMLVDFILILAGAFKDSAGFPVKVWQ